MQHDQTLPMSFEDWKLRYRQRIAAACGIKSECFDETLSMIADDETLHENYAEGLTPDEAADEEMSYWGE